MRAMENTSNYESPTLEVVGSLEEITKAGTDPNRDSLTNPNNTAFPPAS